MAAQLVRGTDGGGYLVTDPVAAIDCGTNSIRLLVARPDGRGGLVDLDRRMLVVRLGEGLDRTGEITPAALDRTLAACRQYAAAIERHGVAAVRFVATSASRDARNAAEFTAGVRDVLGVEPEVVSGAEEAALSFDGATRSVPHDEPVLVFDIGGGSTEFVLGAGAARQAISVDLGCVRFYERFFESDPATAAEVMAAEQAVDELLEDVAAVVSLTDARDVVGTAGTVTTVAALALRLPRYDAATIHGARIPAVDVHRVRDELIRMPMAQRRDLPVMHPGRADVIAAGAVILSRILEQVGADHVVASEHDILDGIAWSLLSST